MVCRDQQIAQRLGASAGVSQFAQASCFRTKYGCGQNTAPHYSSSAEVECSTAAYEKAGAASKVHKQRSELSGALLPNLAGPGKDAQGTFCSTPVMCKIHVDQVAHVCDHRSWSLPQYEDPEFSEHEYKAARRVQSADLLAKLKVSVDSLCKRCRVIAAFLQRRRCTRCVTLPDACLSEL